MLDELQKCEAVAMSAIRFEDEDNDDQCDEAAAEFQRCYQSSLNSSIACTTPFERWQLCEEMSNKVSSCT